MSNTVSRCPTELRRCSRSALLEKAGMPRDRARTVADVIVEGDLLGHDTHGLDQLAGYLVQIEEGLLATSKVIRRSSPISAPASRGRPSPARTLAREAAPSPRRAAAYSRIPIVTVVIGRGHHIGCLQAYLKPVTDAGFIIVLMCSDPSAAGVTPHGGVASRITPNPIAAGFPTGGDPDSHRHQQLDVDQRDEQAARVERRAARKARGLSTPTDRRPTILACSPRDRPGAMLPLGGIELGHKGFSLALIVEALTSGLAGRGRSEKPAPWTSSVFVQLIDPDAFGGRDAFAREMQHLVDLCHDTPVAPGNPPRSPSRRRRAGSPPAPDSRRGRNFMRPSCRH